MKIEPLIEQMTQNAERIAQLVAGVSAQQACWKPDAGTWSMLEVVNHLVDEEQYDFRMRLEYILYRPGVNPPDIDPPGWVVSRGYNQRDMAQSVVQFMQARSASILWLQSLPAADWQIDREAAWGMLTVGDLFAAWVAHDILHMRQLVELHWAWLVAQVTPCRVTYAGEW